MGGNELPIMSFDETTELTSGGTCDLSNYGTYYTRSKDISESLTNSPFTDSNFRLWHFGTGLWNYPAQLAISFREGMAMRGKNNTEWYDWKYFVFKDDLATTTSDGLMSAADKQKLDGINMSQYAKLNSPTFTGTPTAPTNSNYDVSKQLATDAYVLNQIASANSAIMVRCIFNCPSNVVQNVIETISQCVFMAVNGKAVEIVKSQKLPSYTS
jgi:hypothetical protein